MSVEALVCKHDRTCRRTDRGACCSYERRRELRKTRLEADQPESDNTRTITSRPAPLRCFNPARHLDLRPALDEKRSQMVEGKAQFQGCLPSRRGQVTRPFLYSNGLSLSSSLLRSGTPSSSRLPPLPTIYVRLPSLLCLRRGVYLQANPFPSRSLPSYQPTSLPPRPIHFPELPRSRHSYRPSHHRNAVVRMVLLSLAVFSASILGTMAQSSCEFAFPSSPLLGLHAFAIDPALVSEVDFACLVSRIRVEWPDRAPQEARESSRRPRRFFPSLHPSGLTPFILRPPASTVVASTTATAVLATPTSFAETDWTYAGCYVDTSAHVLTAHYDTSTAQTQETCVRTCNAGGWGYAGLVCESCYAGAV